MYFSFYTLHMYFPADKRKQNMTELAFLQTNTTECLNIEFNSLSCEMTLRMHSEELNVNVEVPDIKVSIGNGRPHCSKCYTACMYKLVVKICVNVYKLGLLVVKFNIPYRHFWYRRNNGALCAVSLLHHRNRGEN